MRSSEKDEEGGHWRSYEGDDDKPEEVARQFMDSKRSLITKEWGKQGWDSMNMYYEGWWSEDRGTEETRKGRINIYRSDYGIMYATTKDRKYGKHESEQSRIYHLSWVKCNIRKKKERK